MKRYCFVGLGNPGEKYRGSRHNIGFDWIDRVFAEFKKSFSAFQSRFDSEWCSGNIDEKEVHLLKPQTYMNLSGKAVLAWKKKYQGDTQIFVVMDELDLELGRLRLKEAGGDAGHRGLRSVMECLGTSEVARLRIGVGRPSDEASDYVLESFTPDERKVVGQVLEAAPFHFKTMLNEDFSAAMNVINGWRATKN